MSKSKNVGKIEILPRSGAVRQRPRMYFNDCFEEGNLNSMAREVACHAVDEILDGNCQSLKITVSEEYFEVSYDAGMSLDTPESEGGITTIAEIMMTTLFACKNLKKHVQVGDDLCHLGIAAVNFASEWCTVTTISQNKRGVFTYETGTATSRDIQSTDEPDRTTIKVKPDQGVFGELWFTYEGIRDKVGVLSEKLSNFEIIVEKA